MSQESEIEAEDISNFYYNFNTISQEIIEGAKEGFKEGLVAGIQSGLEDIVGLGFSGTKAEKARSGEDIIRDAAGEGLKNMASTITKRNACPIMKKWLEDRCDEVVRRLAARGSINTAQDATHLASYLKLEEEADKKFKQISDQAKVALPSSFIADALFTGVQETLWGCTKDGIKSCQKRISEIKDAQKAA